MIKVRSSATCAIIFGMEEETDIPRLLGENLRKFRTQRQLTQAELSEQLGITQKHLSIIENGRQFPSPALIARISRTLAVRPAQLFGGGDDSAKIVNALYGLLSSHINSRIELLYSRIESELLPKFLARRGDGGGF